MQKQAPTLGRVLVMAGFALSCFGLLLFLWLAFGGPVPLKPKGYRFQTSFGEATQLAKEADVRISGVSVGKVKSIETQPDGRSKAVIELESKYAPMPKDTKAILRQKTLLGETYVELTPGDKSSGIDPRGRDAARRAGVADRRARRDLPRPGPADAQGVPDAGCRTRRSRSPAAARTSTTRWATSRRSPRTPPSCSSPQLAGGRDAPAGRNTGEVFDALSERDHQLRSLITNSNRVFETTAAPRRRAQRHLPRPADVREGVLGRTVTPPGRVREQDQPADHPAAPGGARS